MMMMAEIIVPCEGIRLSKTIISNLQDGRFGVSKQEDRIVVSGEQDMLQTIICTGFNSLFPGGAVAAAACHQPRVG